MLSNSKRSNSAGQQGVIGQVVSALPKHPLDQCRLMGSVPFKDGIVIEVREITPGAAGDLCTDRWNNHNRNMNERFVEAYVKDRTAGAWEATSNGFAFDPEGVVIDGQKRLRSIALSGKTSVEFCLRNVPTRAQRVMDKGEKRTDANDEQIEGHDYANERAAWIRALHTIPSGSSRRMAVCERDAIVRRYKRSLGWAMENITPKLGLKKANVMGAFILAHHKYPKETDAFFQKVLVGDGLRLGEPAHTLRDYLGRLPTIKQTPRHVSCKVLRAIQAHLEGEKIARLEFTVAPLAHFGLRAES